MSKKLLIGYFALLYFVQGAAQSYFRNFQKPYLSDIGISADAIGFLSLILMLPFIIKVIFGYLSDRFNLLGFGHRKPYLFLGLLISILGFCTGAFFLPESNFTLYAVAIVCAGFGVALFDSTADGLAIEVSAEKDQGLVQSAMIAGKSAGFILVSIVIGYLATNFGFRSVYFMLATLTLIPLFLIPWVPEKKILAKEEARPRDFLNLMNLPFLFFILYALSYTYASFGIDGLATFYLRKQFLVSDAALGQFGATSGLGAVVGAVSAGLALARFDNLKIAIIATLGICLGALLAAFYLNDQSMFIFAGIWGFLWALQETVFVTYAMRFSQNHIAASTFALLMVFSNLGQALTENFSTAMTATIGFQNVFIVLAVVCIIPMATLKAALSR